MGLVAQLPQARIDASARGERQPDLEDGPRLRVDDEQAPEHALDRLPGVVAGLDGLHALRDLVDDQLHRKREQLRLGREDVAERAGGHARLGRHLADRRGFDPVPQDDPPDGLPELPAAGFRCRSWATAHSSTFVLTVRRTPASPIAARVRPLRSSPSTVVLQPLGDVRCFAPTVGPPGGPTSWSSPRRTWPSSRLLPAGAAWWLAAVSTAATVLIGLVVVTAVYRTTRRPPVGRRPARGGKRGPDAHPRDRDRLLAAPRRGPCWLGTCSTALGRASPSSPRLPSSTSSCSRRRRSTCVAAGRRRCPMRSPPSTSASPSRGAGGWSAWADARFAHRFAGGPAPRAAAPERPSARGPPAARVASPPGRVGNRYHAAGSRSALRGRPRPHLGAPQRRRALDARPRDRLRDLVQLHALAAGAEPAAQPPMKDISTLGRSAVSAERSSE